LDASALICLVRREPGWEKVAAFGLSCDLSAVNFTEVAYRLSAHGMPLERVEPFVRPMVGDVVPFDENQALLAASIHAGTRQQGLSLADCACLALATSRQATVVTADKKWAALKLKLKIVQIR
jgi:PIN domain nuclease of toxin-antitoxin system